MASSGVNTDAPMILPGPRSSSRHVNGEVLLPEMNAGGINGKGDVHAVIDDQGDPPAVQKFFDPQCFPVEFTGIDLFFAQLDNRYASLDGGLDDLEKGPAQRKLPVRDQIKRVIYGSILHGLNLFSLSPARLASENLPGSSCKGHQSWRS